MRNSSQSFRFVELTGIHDKDFRAVHSLFSSYCSQTEKYKHQFESLNPHSLDAQHIQSLYLSSMVLQLKAALVLNAIAPKDYGEPSPSRILSPTELRRAQVLVDALCSKFTSFYDTAKRLDAIKDIPSCRSEFEKLEETKSKLERDLDSLTLKITNLYWINPPCFPIKTANSDTELEELREKVKKLELENKALSTLNRNDFSKNSQLQKQIASYRHAVEEKDATISVLKRRLENFDSSKSPLPSDGDQLNALKQQLLDRDVQLEQLQKRYDKLDENYARDLDKVSFVDNLLVFLDRKNKLYHCFGCSEFNTDFDYGGSFICCDRRTARKLGYTSCDFCYRSDPELCTED